jgi:hypothetical protein
MALQTFTAGQVLTAAQVNALQANDYNQTVSTKTGDYVLVAADKGTRVVMNSASAQTITVNTSLFSAGDTLFIQNIGAGVCTITAGTATVSTAGSLALAQNAGGTLYFTSAGVSIFFPTVATSGATGLTLIKTQTIGSAVSSVNVTGAFSATYENYKIIISGGVGSTTANMTFKLGATATGYYYASTGFTFTNTSVGSGAGNQSTFAAVTRSGVITASADIELQNPFLTKETIVNYRNIDANSAGSISYGGGYLVGSTSYTDFTIAPTSGTYTGGTIFVYGYNK